jgi:prevent-host-death family protein
MSTTAVDVDELPRRLEEMLSLAADGTEVILTVANVPKARLVPLTLQRARTPGLHPGAIQTSEDFNSPLPDEFWTGSE